MNISVEFDYYGKTIQIPCKDEEEMKEIFYRYSVKAGKNIKDLFFLHNGERIKDENLKLANIIKNTNRNNGKIIILVKKANENDNPINKLKSKEIICPECKEISLINIKNYRINLFGCKDMHIKNNISFNEYKNTQDISHIECHCSNKIVNMYNHTWYICNTCGINLCPICRSKHDVTHYIINYEDKYYFCNKHKEKFTEFCEICNKNLCPVCVYEHELHNNSNNIKLLDIIQDKDELQIDLSNLEGKLKLFLNKIEEIIRKLNDVKNNFENYIEIYKDIIKNFDESKRNYYMLKNINKFKEYNEHIIDDINKMEYLKDNDKLIMIMDIYGQMNNNIEHKINHKFIEEPEQLKYRFDITDSNDFNGYNDIFEVFISYIDKEEYVVSPNRINHNLDIFKLSEREKVLSLKGHNNYITTLRYFIDNKTSDEYLISADEDKMVILWYINDNYNIKYKIDTEYASNIYSCLLVFTNYENGNFIITSTDCTVKDINKSASKIYSLQNGQLIKKIQNTNNLKIFYLILWHHKKDNKYYIIELAKKKIIITSLLDEDLYSELMDEPDNEYKSGYVFNKKNKDYLCCSSSSNGTIKIWDLEEKKLFKNINVKDNLYHIIEWNNKYMIAADFINKSFKIIDYEGKKEPITVKAQHKEFVKSVKKILHPKYGESLLTASRDKTIKLWSV